MQVSEEKLRTAMLLGENAMQLLQQSKVAVIGVGGVGGHACLTLARGGVGSIFIVDADTVAVSNMNRQVVAKYSTIGRKKTEVMREMLADISQASITASDTFLLPDNIESVLPNDIDFIIDAIDTVSAKLALCEYARRHSVPMISCMGMGNRLNPTQIRIGDISEVCGCPLARVMRRELKKRGIDKQQVCYSLEMPMKPEPLCTDIGNGKRQIPGNVAYVPSMAGIAMAGYAMNSIVNDTKKHQ